MAEVESSEIFNKWLNKKLESFEVDDVLVSYINSIIITDDPEPEKRAMLKDIFEELGPVGDIEEMCSEILSKWSDSCEKNDAAKKIEMPLLDLGERVSLLVEQSVQSVVKQPSRSAEEEKLRQAILSRCNYISEEEDDYCESDDGGATAPSLSLPPAAGNAEGVAREERERREKLKTESDKKKVQDKAGREKQKQKQEERKEKERKRTQKQEKRR